MYICLSAVGQVNLEIVGIAQQESAGQPMHSVNLLMTNETCLSGTNTAKMDRVLLEVTAAACVCWQIPASAYCILSAGKSVLTITGIAVFQCVVLNGQESLPTTYPQHAHAYAESAEFLAGKTCRSAVQIVQSMHAH